MYVKYSLTVRTVHLAHRGIQVMWDGPTSLFLYIHSRQIKVKAQTGKKRTKLLQCLQSKNSKTCEVLCARVMKTLIQMCQFPINLGSRLERPIHFECKLNEPMHIGMRLLHPAAAEHSVSISRQQVQRIFSFSLWSQAVTSFCS